MKNLRVLHCDDEEPIRYLVKEIMRPHPAVEIVEAEDHADVVIRAAVVQPDLVLLDLDAHRDEAVIEQLRATCSARIVVLSGEHDLADDPLVAQADGFVSKRAGVQAIASAVLDSAQPDPS